MNFTTEKPSPYILFRKFVAQVLKLDKIQIVLNAYKEVCEGEIFDPLQIKIKILEYILISPMF